VWSKPLTEEAAATGEVLLETLEPYQREIEHHFTLEGQRRFRGIMASYLHLFTRVRYVGSSLRDRIPFLPRSREGVQTPTVSWDLARFTRSCSDVAANRMLDARGKALANRLLVEADTQGFPVALLNEPIDSLARIDWRQRYAQILNEVLTKVEQQWARPTGARRWIQGTLVLLADWVPPLVLLGGLLELLWRFFDPLGKGYAKPSSLFDILLPIFIMLIVLVILHLVIALLLPLRWPAIRGEFQKQLVNRLQQELENAYTPVPGEVADQLLAERRQTEKLIGETNEVATWLAQREQSASIASLYGH
jgi:hypothetical protein